ncbi:unnamed protein product [Camellia sinensis]
MHGFSIWLDSRHHPHPFPTPPSLFLEAASASHPLPSFLFFPTASARIVNSRSRSTSMSISSASSQSFHANCSNIDSIPLFGGGGGDENEDEDEDEEELPSIYGGGEIEIEKIGNNCRRIRSMIAIEASLQTVWNILTDYERLADFIPGLAVSQLLEKRPNFARLFQIGQQKLAFGLNFNAKGIVDCYEKDLESLPFGQRRDIEFKMVEGDFLLFEGKWSIEQSVKVMDICFKNTEDFIAVYIDDILVFSPDEKSHAKHIQSMLEVKTGTSTRSKSPRLGNTKGNSSSSRFNHKARESLSRESLCKISNFEEISGKLRFCILLPK